MCKVKQEGEFILPSKAQGWRPSVLFEWKNEIGWFNWLYEKEKQPTV